MIAIIIKRNTTKIIKTCLYIYWLLNLDIPVLETHLHGQIDPSPRTNRPAFTDTDPFPYSKNRQVLCRESDFTVSTYMVALWRGHNAFGRFGYMAHIHERRGSLSSRPWNKSAAFHSEDIVLAPIISNNMQKRVCARVNGSVSPC